MTITPRQKLDFGLTGDIPRYWFGGDPFRTRFFDAHSLVTPSGEKFFINCVREFKEGIADPQLSNDVDAFIRQEGQHSIQHGLWNKMLQLQGIDAATIEAERQAAVEKQRQQLPRRFALALTAANEHLTAMVAHAVLERPALFAEADQRIFALYAWHCAEEFEHKAVSFDVMQKVARVGYLMRVFAMWWASLAMQILFTQMIDRLLRADGFSLRQRLTLGWRGFLWLYGRDGFMRPQLGYLLSYFRPGFHPSQFNKAPGYDRWLSEFQRSKDPLRAAASLRGGS
jgi:predicted metal-dependent hydrolase